MSQKSEKKVKVSFFYRIFQEFTEIRAKGQMKQHRLESYYSYYSYYSATGQ